MNGDPSIAAARPEVDEIVARYERRDRASVAQRYNILMPAVYMSMQERERALIGWLRSEGSEEIGRRRLLDIGCGSGADLLLFLRLGFAAQNLRGIDLLPQRVAAARERLPAALQIFAGDAQSLELASESFDIVLASTVFSSILDPDFRAALARTMWRVVKPGGGVLWYDFVFNNPRNPDVRGVRPKEVARLFPSGVTTYRRRLTLAPPVARWVTRLHPACYSAVNALPLLRTHILSFIRKSV